MRIAIAILTFIFIMTILGVMLMNTSETVTVRLLWNSPDYEYPDIPLGVVLFAAAFVGFAFTGTVAVLEGMKTRIENKSLARRVRRLQRQIESMKRPNLPLPEPEEEEVAAAERS